MTTAMFFPQRRNIVFMTFNIILMIAVMIGCNQKSEKRSNVGAKTSATPTDAKVLRTVNFLPGWIANAQFAGFYVADAKGIYNKYGIKINIISYEPFVTTTNQITNGSTDFATLWLSNAIKLRASGTEIVNIAQLSSRSSAMLVTKKKSGINTIQDINGKRAGVWSDNELQFKALFKKYRLDVEIIPIGSTNNLFLMDGIDLISANWHNEYHSIINSGFNPDELNTFFLADFGMNFLEDGIYCLSGKLKSDPQLCADFVNASLEGWMYAFDHPEEAIDVVMKYIRKNNQPVNRPHQQWMLNRYKDLYLPKEKTTLSISLSSQDYQFIGNLLKESGLIAQIPAYDVFYQPIVNSH
jgi:NitT/TauT family transport system substrate-binding protein